ncbi:MAG TPA: AMP-binding protein, partial [Myxococcaceae bacterium]|nr:AMP-binding protein [Myxococcaceae bacterium]
MTLWQLIEERAAKSPRATFVMDERDRSLTFEEYRDTALKTASGLLQLGVEPGSVVSWTLPTRLEALVLAAALSRLDVVQNPLLPVYRHREVSFAVKQTGARWLVVPSIWRK